MCVHTCHVRWLAKNLEILFIGIGFLEFPLPRTIFHLFDSDLICCLAPEGLG